MAFIRSVYAPTEFKWEKRNAKPQFFATPDLSQQTPENKEIEAETTKSGGPSFMKNLEETEKQILSSVANLFNPKNNAPSGPQPTVVNQVAHPQSQPQTPIPNNNRAYSDQPPSSQVNEKGRVLTERYEDQEEVVTVRTKHHEVKVPETNKIKVQKRENPDNEDLKEITTKEIQGGLVDSLDNQTQEGQPAQFSPDAAPPMPPSQPNVIVGQVMDKDKKIIDGAILEIKDENGRPVRALRSNKLGHFLIVTPLNNGNYTISTEKEGFEFDNITLNAKGEVIPPIAVYAKS